MEEASEKAEEIKARDENAMGWKDVCERGDIGEGKGGPRVWEWGAWEMGDPGGHRRGFTGHLGRGLQVVKGGRILRTSLGKERAREDRGGWKTGGLVAG